MVGYGLAGRQGLKKSRSINGTQPVYPGQPKTVAKPGHKRERITSSFMGPYGRSLRFRVLARWHCVRGTGYPCTGVALGGVGSERRWIRISYCVRTLSAEKLTWFGSPTRRLRRSAWSIRGCRWRKHTFTLYRTDRSAPTAPASLTRDLADHYGASSLSCRARHKCITGTSFPEITRRSSRVVGGTEHFHAADSAPVALVNPNHPGQRIACRTQATTPNNVDGSSQN